MLIQEDEFNPIESYTRDRCDDIARSGGVICQLEPNQLNSIPYVEHDIDDWTWYRVGSVALLKPLSQRAWEILKGGQVRKLVGQGLTELQAHTFLESNIPHKWRVLDFLPKVCANADLLMTFKCHPLTYGITSGNADETWRVLHRDVLARYGIDLTPPIETSLAKVIELLYKNTLKGSDQESLYKVKKLVEDCIAIPSVANVGMAQSNLQAKDDNDTIQ